METPIWFKLEHNGVYLSIYENRRNDLEINIGDETGDNITLSIAQIKTLSQIIESALAQIDKLDRTQNINA